MSNKTVIVADDTAFVRDRFATAHPQVPTAVIPALAGDVHDLEGLRRIGDLLAAAGRT